MTHITIGRPPYEARIVPVQCVPNDDLQRIRIRNECFLLLVVTEGRLTMRIGKQQLVAEAPCFVCFDERHDPALVSQENSTLFAIYFHPTFLNVNMSFQRLRSWEYADEAHNHDMFLLRPFLDAQYVVPLCHSYVEPLIASCEGMERELRDQRDWFWSCRGRSYFMEIIIALERMYALATYGENGIGPFGEPLERDHRLQGAILFIEGHFAEDMKLSDIVEATYLNHTTLTALMRQRTGMTPMEYLMDYRVRVAKKQLAFTAVPIKDVSRQCGFKTVQHFNRVFKELAGETPAVFRREAVRRRREDFTR